MIISVLTRIQTYWCRIFILPKQVLKEIDAILRTFLWAGVSLRRFTPEVAWCDVYVPKKEGGLGIPNSLVANKALMAKQDLARKKDTLWVKWCHTCIIKGRCMWTFPIPQNASWTWRRIMKLRSTVQRFINYKISNGQDTCVWLDSWGTQWGH